MNSIFKHSGIRKYRHWDKLTVWALTAKLRRELELREERWANAERREADEEGEDMVRRKEREGEGSEEEDLAGKALVEEEMRVVEEVTDAIVWLLFAVSERREAYLWGCQQLSLGSGSIRWRWAQRLLYWNSCFDNCLWVLVGRLFNPSSGLWHLMGLVGGDASWSGPHPKQTATISLIRI